MRRGTEDVREVRRDLERLRVWNRTLVVVFVVDGMTTRRAAAAAAREIDYFDDFDDFDEP